MELSLIVVILVDIRSIRMIDWSGCHIWGGWCERRSVELALTWRGPLRRGIVILLVHIVLLAWIRHFLIDGRVTRGADVRSPAGSPAISFYKPIKGKLQI